MHVGVIWIQTLPSTQWPEYLPACGTAGHLEGLLVFSGKYPSFPTSHFAIDFLSPCSYALIFSTSFWDLELRSVTSRHA